MSNVQSFLPKITKALILQSFSFNSRRRIEATDLVGGIVSMPACRLTRYEMLQTTSYNVQMCR